MNSYEIGWKASLLDRRLTFALDGFYADYKDVQIPGSVGCDTNGDGVNETFCGITTNAGKATIKGVELEANAVLARDFAGPGSSINFAGDRSAISTPSTRSSSDDRQRRRQDPACSRTRRSGRLSGTLGATLPVGADRVDCSTTVSYRSLTHQFETPIPLLDQPGYALWDANLTYSFGDDRYSIGVHGKNLTDKRYMTSGYNYVGAERRRRPTPPTLGKQGIATAFYGNPRQVFATATAKF